MKKFLIMAALVLSSAAAFAQYRPGNITIQPKIGLNVSNLSHTSGSDWKAGLLTGVEAEFYIKRWFGISAGMMYSQQGYKYDYDNHSYTVNMDYINMPVLANFYVAKGLDLKVGLQPGVNVNSKDGWDVNTFDLSMPLGISYEFKGFCFDWRCNIGLTDVFKNDQRNYDDAAKHELLSFTFGYKFKVK